MKKRQIKKNIINRIGGYRYWMIKRFITERISSLYNCEFIKFKKDLQVKRNSITQKVKIKLNCEPMETEFIINLKK